MHSGHFEFFWYTVLQHVKGTIHTNFSRTQRHALEWVPCYAAYLDFERLRDQDVHDDQSLARLEAACRRCSPVISLLCSSVIHAQLEG